MDALELATIIFYTLMSCITCNDDYMCKTVVTNEYRVELCDVDGCRYVEVGPFENSTCKNFEEMHATPNICDLECTIIFTEQIEIIRTNSFSLLDNLEQVFLNNTGIEVIQSRSFSGLSTLRLINLGNNRIKKIPKNTFSQLPNLEFLNLKENRIEDLEHEFLNDCMSLKNLDLSSNYLRNLSIRSIESLVQLETLNLSANFIEIMDQNWCFHLHSLKYMILDHNRIGSLSNCTSNYNIQIFSMSYNNLESLNGTVFPANTKKLNLSGNHIAVIQNKPFERLKKLEVLDLSKNNLKNLPFKLFENLKKLSHLDISLNPLITLNDGVFHGLDKLTILNLSGIKSPDLEANVFYSTRNIHKMDISGNNMFYINLELLHRFCPNLNFLRIDGNSFTCQDISHILLYAAENKILIPPGDYFEGKHLNGMKCADVQEISTKNGTSNQVLDYFENGFRKSPFFKFFSTFQQPSQNDIHELMEIQKYSIKNISDEIESTEKKISKSIFAGQENSRRMDSTYELLQKLIKTIELHEGLQKNTNLTSELFTILDQQNQAAFTAENADMKNIIGCLDDLKFILVIILLILITLVVAKLFRKLKNYFPMNKFAISSQELPFIERHNSQRTT